MTTFLSSTRAARVETRMGPDLRNVIEYTPGIGGLSLWVEFRDVDEETVAYTDGSHVCAGNNYVNYGPLDRQFICQHELLHVGLQHPARARSLRERDANFDNELYNIATDAIINAALVGSLRRLMPQDAINLETVLQGIKKWPEDGKIDDVVRKWSSEQLYFALRDEKKATGKSNGELAAGVEAGARPGGFTGDLKPGHVHGETQEDRNATAREWAHRIKQAAGLTPGLLERLVGDLPTVRTPWERYLRDFLHRHGSPKRVIDYARPSRRWTALEHTMRVHEGVDLPFQPATRPGPSGRIAIAVDSSGSTFSEELLRRFSGEVAGIMQRTGAKVRLIVCDAQVHQVEDLAGASGIQRLRNFTYQGGGGTDFKPAIAAAAEWKPDALVFLTDLIGDAGKAPRFPVMWAVPAQYSDVPMPFGQRIDLD